MIDLHHGDNRDILPTIPSASVDAVITDPIYPEISRQYGRITVAEWWDLMMIVCKETRRILKPTGSAVFILQPNSEHVGQMRGWLWEFMAWVCRDWNMVQDVWWWNSSMPPTTHCNRWNQLMRPSLRAMVWAGAPDCYRKQQEILWTESARNAHWRAFGQNLKSISGHNVKQKRCASVALERGGTTPFNVVPLPNSDGTSKHGAGTPLKLADWWTRYICPPGGTVADWFVGSGTMMLAAIQNGCDGIGIEKFPEPGREINDKDNPDYFGIAQSRIAAALSTPEQLTML